MDNVTRTLVGLIIGESAAAQTGPRERGLPMQTRRTVLMTVALLGSNSPDLDLLVSFRGSSAGNLGYMLWHRGWHYGDRVFIVEPLYWVAAAPLWWGLRRAASRLLFALAVVGAVVMGRLSVVLALAVTCAFALAGREAAQRAEGLAQADFPGDRLLDHVLTPQPANPLCWDLLLLETSGDRYVARHAVLSLGPAASSLSSNPAARDESIEDQRAVLGDLRFDRGRERGSFEVPLRGAQNLDSAVHAGDSRTCRRAAPWVAPRADLTAPSGQP